MHVLWSLCAFIRTSKWTGRGLRSCIERRGRLSGRSLHAWFASRNGSANDSALRLIGQIMDEYATGTPTTQLALRYRIGKGTLLRLLHEHGITIRHQHRR
jgi:hypothetical protein